MNWLDYIKDLLKVLASILALSNAPEGLAKGIVVTAIIVVVGLLWKLLAEFRGWRKDQAALAEEVRKVSVDTKFLVKKHCDIHKDDAYELLELRDKESPSPA